jgi:hypothetical protein
MMTLWSSCLKSERSDWSQAEGLRLMATRKKEGVSKLTPFSYARCHVDFKRFERESLSCKSC